MERRAERYCVFRDASMTEAPFAQGGAKGALVTDEDQDEQQAPAAKKKYPIQIAHEAAMIQAAIDLLDTTDVSKLSVGAVTSAAGVSVPYISRYFGGRDQFILAVADELRGRLMARSDWGRGISNAQAAGAWLVSPEFNKWVSLITYLTTRPGMAEKSPMGRFFTDRMKDGLIARFDLEPERAERFARLTMFLGLGMKVFGPWLGGDEEELLAMLFDVQGLLESSLQQAGNDG